MERIFLWIGVGFAVFLVENRMRWKGWKRPAAFAAAGLLSGGILGWVTGFPSPPGVWIPGAYAGAAVGGASALVLYAGDRLSILKHRGISFFATLLLGLASAAMILPIIHLALGANSGSIEGFTTRALISYSILLGFIISFGYTLPHRRLFRPPAVNGADRDRTGVDSGRFGSKNPPKQK